MPDNDPQTQLVKYLTDVHSIEEQAAVQMRRAPDLVEGPLAEAFQRHLGETESPAVSAWSSPARSRTRRAS
jgi:ferritin-like metal-binding protein YciE